MKKIRVIEVGPRDGFQNICNFIPTDIKLTVIDKLASAGVKDIMITSFVSPGAIPQMRDAAEVAGACLERYPDINLSALVPNLRGALNAVSAGLKELTAVISVSESHNKANVNRTPDESFAELQKILEAYPGAKVTLDLATSFGCPFEGEISLEQVRAAVRRAYGIGIRSIDLCDTVGMAYPTQVREYVTFLMAEFPDVEFCVHIHDTRNMGIVNTLAAIECGITNVQASLGGLGGCPFAPGASGNTSSEDLVYMLGRMGYDTGIDFDKMLEAAEYAHQNIVGNFSGHHIFIKR
ncbi:MAG: hydroxymethylglutaryl-CoA lyase [Oscillospiraceae bacterium]